VQQKLAIVTAKWFVGMAKSMSFVKAILGLRRGNARLAAIYTPINLNRES
jgi:hypothetical protein